MLEVSLSDRRYDRQERITWWDQERLRKARVLVVGAGALGNEVVKNLALLGVGSVVVVDFDVVELSNLARCLFFRESDDGLSKAEALAMRAGELNPEVAVAALDLDVQRLGTGIGRRADVIVGAVDSREARLFVNRLAWRAGRPWVDGAIEALSGVARVFLPGHSCYECTLTEADFEILSHRQSCRLLSHEEMLSGKVPTTATTASAVAGIQAQEVVKLLHHDVAGVRPVEDAVILDGMNNDAYVVRYPFLDDCVAHHVFVDPIEHPVDIRTTFEDLRRAAGFRDSVLVELGDDHLVGWRCSACGQEEPMFGIVALIGFAEARCPDCGSARQPLSVTAVAVPGDYADVPLSRFQTRQDEVFAIRSGLEYRYVWARSPAEHLPEAWR